MIISSEMREIEVGRAALLQEAKALETLSDRLGNSFVEAVQTILSCKGRVITCGLGKSGHIGRKTAGTLSSTGTPSLFLHAAEAVHGDLGMVATGDVTILYTQSGETDEIVRLYPVLREIGAKTITITGRQTSSAARSSDIVLDTGVTEEACPLNLAPTTSTTAMLALSDALALAVMDLRGFGREDFGRLHPSGTLGKRLTLRVTDVMRQRYEIGILGETASGMDAIQSMTTHGVGAVCIERDEMLVGIVSESDLRRNLIHGPGCLTAAVLEMMNPTPATVDEDLLAFEAIEIFQNFPVKIGELPVLQKGRLVGLLVLKDLIRSGII